MVFFSIVRSILDRVLLVLLIGTVYLVAQMAITQSCTIENLSILFWCWAVSLGIDLIFSVVSYITSALDDWETGTTIALITDLLSIIIAVIVGFLLQGSDNSLIAKNCWIVAFLVYHITGSLGSIVSEIASTIEHVDDFD